MDAVKFIKERNRMCKSFDTGCNGCPAFNACEDDLCCAVGHESTLDATVQIDIVAKWSKEHPRKTRQSVFVEQYPEAAIDEQGVLRVCPIYVSAEHRNSDGLCGDPDQMCIECRFEYWMQEVEK